MRRNYIGSADEFEWNTRQYSKLITAENDSVVGREQKTYLIRP